MLQTSRYFIVMFLVCVGFFFSQKIIAAYYSVPTPTDQGEPGQPTPTIQPGYRVPSQQDLRAQLDQIEKQIDSLEKKRDTMKKSLDYFTNETAGYQQDNGLSYRQNADRAKYYQAQINILENQIASLKAKRDQMRMLAH
jgi:hypothetical protein